MTSRVADFHARNVGVSNKTRPKKARTLRAMADRTPRESAHWTNSAPRHGPQSQIWCCDFFDRTQHPARGIQAAMSQFIRFPDNRVYSLSAEC
ncbi:MAG: hypothetical protein Fues2KO_08020 [Fuerstiella sp.]